jgi:hypothetical protein
MLKHFNTPEFSKTCSICQDKFTVMLPRKAIEKPFKLICCPGLQRPQIKSDEKTTFPISRIEFFI